jgi:phage tail sheath protein FI
MATTYKSPGVYVEEIKLLPSSIAEVETAIPAFIGYTEKNPPEKIPVRISSMPEYEELFGGPPNEHFEITITDITGNGGVIIRSINSDIDTNTNNAPSKYLMYYSMKLFFANGGGSCYIISAGNYVDNYTKTEVINETDLLGALTKLEKEDEPTLIVFPDATNMSKAGDFYDLNSQALAQCGKLQDRFALIDVYGESTDVLRNVLVSDYMKYGAVYFPFLQTTFNYNCIDTNVSINHTLDGVAGGFDKMKLNNLNLKDNLNNLRSKDAKAADAVAFIQTLMTKEGIDAYILGDDKTTVLDAAKARKNNLPAGNNALYHQIRTIIDNYTITLPPSSAIAGIYARVDNDRGVWKAPANVPVLSVFGPTQKITDDQQDNLNIDVTAGKSINVIRSFSGKGTLVWGARTLAGNDNEWRYVSVRRFFNMVEESVRKSTAWAVFETNDANTWIRIKGSIENYLTGLWRKGALAGAKADQAFFVNIGLGKTMTVNDILEGRMNIEIGMAAVRPSEFIILKFSHKLQEA